LLTSRDSNSGSVPEVERTAIGTKLGFGLEGDKGTDCRIRKEGRKERKKERKKGKERKGKERKGKRIIQNKFK